MWGRTRNPVNDLKVGVQLVSRYGSLDSDLWQGTLKRFIGAGPRPPARLGDRALGTLLRRLLQGGSYSQIGICAEVRRPGGWRC